MAWKNKRDSFYSDDDEDEYYEDEYEVNEEIRDRKERKKEGTTRWNIDDNRKLLGLADKGKINFEKPIDLGALNFHFPGRTDRVLTAHFKKCKALWTTAQSKAGARKREAGMNLVHLYF